MPARLKERSKQFCLIAFVDEQGKTVKTRASNKQRYKVGSDYLTVYELREEDLLPLQGGFLKAWTIERVSQGEDYVDRLVSKLVLYRLGSWCLTPEG